MCMSDKIYTLDEIRSIANPIARRYNIAVLYLFGSQEFIKGIG